VTYGLGDNIRLAFSDWLESALELKTMYSEDSNILSPGVAMTLQTLERVLERS
jgi:molecular chaperone GrpE (heat shock protein)